MADPLAVPLDHVALDHLLLVEDDPSQRRTLVDILAAEGFHVTCATTVAEGEAALRSAPFALAIVDLRLPDSFRTDVLGRFADAAQNSGFETPLIVHTAFASFETAKAAVNRGAVAYIEKLSDPQELLNHVHRVANARALAALRHTEERYRFLAEQATDIIARVAADGRLLYVSPAITTLLGHTPADVLGRTIRAFLHPDDVAHTMSRHLTSLGENAGHRLTFRLRAKDRTFRWFEVACRPTLDEAGAVAEVVAVARDVTDRVAAEESLRAAEERWRMLIETAPAAIHEVHVDGRLVPLNAAARRLFGGSDTCELLQYVAASEAPMVLQQVSLAFDGTPVRFRHSALLSGRPRILATHLTPLNAADRITRLIGVTEDASEERRTEEVLIDLARRLAEPGANTVLRSLAEQLALAIDADYVFLSETLSNAPRRVHTLAAYSRGRFLPDFEYDLAGTPCDKVVNHGSCVCPRGAREMFPDDPWLAEMGIDAYIGAPLLSAGGERIGLLCALYVEPLANPWLIESKLGIFARVAESELDRFRSRRQLNMSERQLRFVANNLPAAVWTTDAQLRFTSSLGSGLKSLGLLPHEVVGRTIQEYLGTSDSSLAPIAAHVAALCGRSQEFEFEWCDVLWACHLSPLTDDEGRVSGTIGVAVDITFRKQAEEQLRSYEARLRERDAELAHVDRVSTIGQMAAELAHDINQPLYAIANYGEACLTRLESLGESLPEVSDWLRRIVGQARRAGEIVKHVRKYVRKAHTSRESIDLNQAIRDVAVLLESHLRKNRVQLETDLVSDLPTVPAERVMLEQVLVNLVRNAVDAMSDTPPTERRLRIASRRVDEETVGVTVTDRGCGLPETAEKIFEPFFTTKDDGVGLGLAICRTTIDEHGGRLWAKSAEPGAIFGFDLPIAPLAEPQETTADAELAPA